MRKSFLTVLAGLFILNFIAISTWATTWTLDNTLGPLNGGSLTYSITSSDTGEATLTFDLLGYRTVDGNNGDADTFSLTINGVTVFVGGFDMGGGGNTFITSSEGVTIVSTVSNGINNGGLTQFSVVFDRFSGINTIVFNYGSMQGLSDEGWGLRNLTITADPSPVPEPTTMVLLGIGALVLSASRIVRKKA